MLLTTESSLSPSCFVLFLYFVVCFVFETRVSLYSFGWLGLVLKGHWASRLWSLERRLLGFTVLEASVYSFTCSMFWACGKGEHRGSRSSWLAEAANFGTARQQLHKGFISINDLCSPLYFYNQPSLLHHTLIYSCFLLPPLCIL